VRAEHPAVAVEQNFVVAVVNMPTDDEDALARQLRASVPPRLMTTFKRQALLSPLTVDPADTTVCT